MTQVPLRVCGPLAPLALAIGIARISADPVVQSGDVQAAQRLVGVTPPTESVPHVGTRRVLALTDDTLCVDRQRSSVRWLGTKLGGKHEGTVDFARGSLSRDSSGIAGGTLTVDMRTIDVTDIPRHEVVARRNLLSHLAHDEFFAVNRFPAAQFRITGLTRRDGDAYVVSGDLTIRDSVHNVTFDAIVPVLTGERLHARATFSIDRRRWGVRFDGLTSLIRNAIVHNDFQLRVDLTASIEACNN